MTVPAFLLNPLTAMKAAVILQPSIVSSLILFEERASLTKVAMQGHELTKVAAYATVGLLVFLIQIWALRSIAKPVQVKNDVVPQLLYFLGIVMGANAAIVLNSETNSPTLVFAYLYSSLTLFWSSFLTNHQHERKRESLNVG